MLALKQVNKDVNYHNILKDALELRLHRERHVCSNKTANFQRIIPQIDQFTPFSERR